MQAPVQTPLSPRLINPNDPDTIARWVGSRLVVGFDGTHAHDAGVQRAKDMAERGKIGGLIFFAYNVVSPAQIKALTDAIQTWKVPERNRPLLLIVDQEGGKIARLHRNKGFQSAPSALDLGRASDADAKGALDKLAREVAASGMNVNAAPVIDIHHPDSPAIGKLERSFGESPALIVRRAQQALRAHLEAGVMPAIKHYPGHGSARGDTHRGITDVSGVYEPRELEIFREVLRTGDCPIVMTSHLINKQLDASGTPATFSRPMITDILRKELGFDGIAITDDLLMGAIGDQYGRADTVALAFAAGHDMLCISQNQAALGKGLPSGYIEDGRLSERCIAAVRAGVAKGLLTTEMFAASEQRLGALRRRMREHARHA